VGRSVGESLEAIVDALEAAGVQLEMDLVLARVGTRVVPVDGVVVIAGLFDLPDQQIEVRREDPVAGAVKISANQGTVNLALKLSPLTVDFLV